MKVLLKLSVWEQLDVPSHLEGEVKKLLESGELTNGNQLFDWLNAREGYVHCEMIHDTETYLTPEENGGPSTVELLDGYDVVWSNGEIE